MTRTPRALRQRDFTLLWSGQTASTVGDGIYTVALALETLRVSNHASTLAYVEAARVAPNVLILLFAGAIVDRLPRRLVVLAADSTRGLGIAAIAGLVAAHALNIPELIGISVAVGLADAFFYPAYAAIIPEVLPPDLLAQGNAFNSGSQVLGGSLIGPALAGILIGGFGAASAFAVDAATFAISAGCLLSMRAVAPPASSGKSILADAKVGFGWVRRQPWLWYGILAVSVANFAGFAPFSVLGAVLVRDTLHQGAVAFGLVFAVAGLGGAAASVIVGRVGTPRRIITVIWIGWAIGSFAVLGLAFAPDVAVVAFLAAVMFGMMTYGNLLWHTMMQKLVPREMLGRASSVDWLFSLCLTPLGILAAGALAPVIGVRETFLAGGALSAAACLLVVVLPRVHEPERTGLFGRDSGGAPAQSAPLDVS